MVCFKLSVSHIAQQQWRVIESHAACIVNIIDFTFNAIDALCRVAAACYSSCSFTPAGLKVVSCDMAVLWLASIKRFSGWLMGWSLIASTIGCGLVLEVSKGSRVLCYLLCRCFLFVWYEIYCVGYMGSMCEWKQSHVCICLVGCVLCNKVSYIFMGLWGWLYFVDLVAV